MRFGAGERTEAGAVGGAGAVVVGRRGALRTAVAALRHLLLALRPAATTMQVST